MDCPDCCDKGEPGGCRECGRSREMTASEREHAEYDRQDARRKAECFVRHGETSLTPCRLGTRGCRILH